MADGVDGGIPDSVIRHSGSWKSEACFEGYIADEVAREATQRLQTPPWSVHVPLDGPEQLQQSDT